MRGYDIIVIGAGSGGLNVAMFMNKAGFKVLLIDKSDKSIGGDCLNFGCVPSKALIHASRLIYGAKQSQAFGIKTSGEANLKKVMDYVNSKQEIIRKHENAEYFRSLGIDVALGEAKFASRNVVLVDDDAFTSKKIVLATGSSPRELKIPGTDKVKCYNNETIFNLKKLPKNFLVIGGGPIGIEIAQAFLRLGSKVTVIQNEDQFLPKEDPEIAEVLLKRLKDEGIKFYFNSSPTKFLSRREIEIGDVNGKKTNIKFDEVFVAIGRKLNIGGLDIEMAGIETIGSKIKVNKYLKTTNPNVFLCGDIVGHYQFTHAAEIHAGVILNNFFSPLKKRVSYDNLSWVTYTTPEIATFGLNEAQLDKKGIKYEKLALEFDDDDRAIVDDYTDSRLILYIFKDKILGGSMVAPNAGELFQELVLAKSSGLKIKNIFNKTYPYPTASRINKRIISNYFSKKLTERAKKILKFMY